LGISAVPESIGLSMSDKVHQFAGDKITVSFDRTRCLHSAECVRGLPTVFDTTRRPWIDPTAGDPDAVAATVSRCPTGALHFHRPDDGPSEPVPSSNRIALSRNGPLYLRGDIRIVADDGTEITRDVRIALCRCGASRRKPLCDGSHLAAGFRDSGMLSRTESVAVERGGPLVVKPTPGGPLRLEGPVEILAEDGTTVSASKVALCRCGASGNKPFCDGSHGRVRMQE
jgi:CDGSH-type Zn-finger protein/uncharacterized Fe-S cluster protein YjdI